MPETNPAEVIIGVDTHKHTHAAVALTALGARRIREGTTWYWDLKPDFQPGDVVEI